MKFINIVVKFINIVVKFNDEIVGVSMFCHLGNGESTLGNEKDS